MCKACAQLTRSCRKHIRLEKAKIRRMSLDAETRTRKFIELYAKFGISLADPHYAR